MCPTKATSSLLQNWLGAAINAVPIMAIAKYFPHETARRLYEIRARYRQRHLDLNHPFGTLETDAHLRIELKEAERQFSSAISNDARG